VTARPEISPPADGLASLKGRTLDVSSRRSSVVCDGRGLEGANLAAGASAPAVLFREVLSITIRARAEWLTPHRCPRCRNEHVGAGIKCPGCISNIQKLRRAAEKSNAVQARAAYRRERGL
jgi:hypothetical protein